MQKYPVISLSLKSAKQPDWELSYIMLKRQIAAEFERHHQILGKLSLIDQERFSQLENQAGDIGIYIDALELSYIMLKRQIAAEFERHHQILGKLSLIDQERFSQLENQAGDIGIYIDALAFLSKCLHEAYGKTVIILIDEYDVPLENAYFNGFYQQMIDFIRSLFESALKTNPHLYFAVITGCLRITKESIFTGLNNLAINSIMNISYGELLFCQSVSMKLMGKQSLS